MDNTKAQSLPPGYSQSDIVGGNNLPPGYSDSDIVSNSSSPQSDEIQSQPGDSLLTQGAKAVGGTLEGIGEGVFGKLAGATDMLGGKGTGASNELHHLAGDNNAEHGTGQNVGRSLESVGEFLLGDEALKGLSVADRLTQVSKVMKLIEKSPRLAHTLRLGINVGKAGAELSPEERALLQQHPVLARLAGAGLDAIRHGVVQGGQTLVKTGGNANEAEQSALTTAGTSAALGGVLGTAGGLLSKGANAAEDVSNLRTLAENAPTSEEANSQLDAALQGSETNQAVQGASSVAEEAAKNAPTSQAITSKAQQAAKSAYGALGNAFEKGRDYLTSVTDGQTQEYNPEHPLWQAAQELANEGNTESRALDEAFSKGRPASPKVNERINRLLDPHGFDDEIGQINDDIAKQNEIINNPKTKPEALARAQQAVKDNNARLDEIEQEKKDNPIHLDMTELLDRRKQLNEMLRNTGWATDEQRADRDVYHRLIDGIDSSIQDMVSKSKDPDAMNVFQKMNSDYKTGIARFKNPDVKAILQGDSENRIVNLLSGGKSVGDIQTIKSAIGKPAFAQLADDAAQRIAADSVNKSTGQFDFNTFFKNWNKIPADVRGEMFEGSLKGGALENALGQIKDLNTSGLTDTLKPIMDKGDITKLINNPEQVKALSQLVGPEATGELGKTILQNQIREASTSLDKAGNVKIGNIDTNKFLTFINQFKDSPETLNTLFKATPETEKAYNNLLQQVHNVDRVKEMVKLGVIAPALGATAAGAIHHTGLSLLLGAAAAEGAGGSVKFARDILDTIANHPATWATLRALGKASQSNAAALGSTVVRAAVGKKANSLRNIYQQTRSQLQ